MVYLPQGYGSVPNGTTVLIDANTTDSSLTVPQAETWAKFYDVNPHTYDKIEVDANVEVITGALSTAQDVTISVAIDTTLKNFTHATSGASTRGRTRIKTVSTLAFSGGRVGIKVSAPAADANTTITVKSLFVYGVV